jgi:selenide,water dikinase
VQSTATPIVKDLVLLGGGHSHVTVLKRFGMKPLPGVRITLICREHQAPYSGMLPGFIAGHYSFDEAHIELGPLARFAGARFYHDRVVGLDLAGKKVLCAGRPPVPYDVLSINIGSAPITSSVPGAEGNVVPVKPIDGFVEAWERVQGRILGNSGASRIAVVGGGAGGVEIALSVQYRLRHLLAAQDRDPGLLEMHLFTDTDDILPTHNRFVRARFNRVLRRRDIQVHTGAPVERVAPGQLIRASQSHGFDEILWVTMAGAQSWLAEAGLQVGEKGFVQVDTFLRAVGQEDIFAAGDVADMIDHPRPKSGVFAVRQGQPLADNLRRRLLGRPLRPFRPQSQFLSLITTGDKYAVASRNGWALAGRYIWRWKDWIDQRFMRKFNVLPDMAEEGSPNIARGLASADVIKEISAIAMRCGGCGAKVGSSVLQNALAALRPVERDDVLIGLHEPDDAAVVSVPEGKVMVHTVDSFRSFIEDPYIFGQVAANHALGDIYAMGGEPQTALALVTLPFGLESKVEDELSQMMAGALAVLEVAGTALVGGHTSEGAEATLGFAVNGLADRATILRKGGMRPGDVLVLTKAVGTGTLFAADMRHRARGRWIDAALRSMIQSNRDGARCLFDHGATACTDVTGFGLLGHLVEMTRPSGVDVEVALSSVPILDGALEMVAAGIFSSLQPQNVRLRRAIHDVEAASCLPGYPLLFDPQTAGGLLASVPAARADACVEALHALGYARAAVIGRVLAESDRLEPVTIIN